MRDDLTRARFPEVRERSGHYESFYVKLADPQRPRGAWIRYTALKRPGQPAVGSVWCTSWADDGAPPEARKVTLGPGELGANQRGELIHVGGSQLREGRATGSFDEAAWELEYIPAAETFAYLPRAWMYRGPVPRTKAAALSPHATFHGRVTVGSRTLSVDGWPGMIGHNWGAEHAERWIWVHATGFAEDSGAWLDAIFGRIRVAGLTLPWIANGGLWLGGRLRRLGGPGAVRATKVDERPTRCRFALPGQDVTISGEVVAPERQVVAWRYSDPSGGGHVTCNCSVSALTLSVRGHDRSERVLELAAGAAYELGARESPPPEIPVQPFPDP